MPLAHGPLEKLAENLWVVRGEIPRMPIGRHMVIVRDPNTGSLFIHSAIMLSDAGFRELDALGKVQTIFVPNRFHDIDGGAMKARYPGATLCALPLVAKIVRQKFPNIEPLGSLPPSITITRIDGLRGDESVMEVQTDRGLVQVYTDAFFNLPDLPGVSGTILKWIGSSGGFKMTRLGKIGILCSRNEFRSFIKKQAMRRDIASIIVAHGDRVERDTSKAYTHALDLL